jgi:hypothetical protein
VGNLPTWVQLVKGRSQVESGCPRTRNRLFQIDHFARLIIERISSRWRTAAISHGIRSRSPAAACFWDSGGGCSSSCCACSVFHGMALSTRYSVTGHRHGTDLARLGTKAERPCPDRFDLRREPVRHRAVHGDPLDRCGDDRPGEFSHNSWVTIAGIVPIFATARLPSGAGFGRTSSTSIKPGLPEVLRLQGLVDRSLVLWRSSIRRVTMIAPNRHVASAQAGMRPPHRR